MDTELRGLSFSKTSSPFPNPVLAITGEMSEMSLCLRFSSVKLINPASGEMSEMLLCLRFSSVKLVNPASGEMSEMLLFQRISSVRFS